MYNEYSYVTKEEMEKLVLFKKVVSITKDKVTLEDGTKLEIECTEQDCCAGGGGTFLFNKTDLPLDAVITSFEVGKEEDIPDEDTNVSRNTITLFHNQNILAIADATTDAGNGGYYYSVTSLVVGKVALPFVSA